GPWEKVLPRVAANYDPEGFLEPGPRRESHRHRPGQVRRLWGGVLVFLNSLDPVKRQIAQGDASPVAARVGAGGIFQQFTPGTSRRLHREGPCLGCFSFDELDSLPNQNAEFGLYAYSPPTYYAAAGRAEDNVAGPYRRLMVPDQPVHIDMLPPRFRGAIA